MLNVILEDGGNTFQTTNRHWHYLNATASTNQLAGTIAGAPENSRKHVRSPIDHVGVAVAAFSNQANVFWNRRMRGTGPLAVDNFMEVIGRLDISRFHSYLCPRGMLMRAAFVL